MIELRRDAEEIGQIEVSEPQHVHPGHGGDLVDVLDSFRGFDQAHDQGTIVGDVDLFGDVAALVVVVREAERRAAPARAADSACTKR